MPSNPRSLVYALTIIYLLAFFAVGESENILAAQVARVSGKDFRALLMEGVLGSFVLLSFETMNLVWSKELIALTWDDNDFDMENDKNLSRDAGRKDSLDAGSAFGSIKNSTDSQPKKARSNLNVTHSGAKVGENNA